jgi:hypothetical protein
MSKPKYRFNICLESWYSGFDIDNLPSEDDGLEEAWRQILESAEEMEEFTNEDGEWREGFPELLEDNKHPAGQAAHDAMMEAVGWIEEANSEVRYYHITCGGDDYAYYGVSRSDFA